MQNAISFRLLSRLYICQKSAVYLFDSRVVLFCKIREMRDLTTICYLAILLILFLDSLAVKGIVIHL